MLFIFFFFSCLRQLMAACTTFYFSSFENNNCENKHFFSKGPDITNGQLFSKISFQPNFVLFLLECLPGYCKAIVFLFTCILFITWYYKFYNVTNSILTAKVWSQIPNLNQNMSNFFFTGVYIYLFTYDQQFWLVLSPCDDHEWTFRA